MTFRENRSTAASGESTRTLLERVKAGHEEALDRLTRRYLPALKRLARGRLPHCARGVVETDDLVQETWMHTLGRLDHFEPEHSGALLAYLRTAVLNRVRDELRRARRRPDGDSIGGQLVDPTASPLEEALGREALVRYEAALAQLRPAARHAVVLRLEFGLGYREIAEELACPSADAARMTVKRAILRLAEELADAR